jgi:hypothetical protein
LSFRCSESDPTWSRITIGLLMVGRAHEVPTAGVAAPAVVTVAGAPPEHVSTAAAQNATSGTRSRGRIITL